MRRSIVKGIRDILWGSAWADHVEGAGCCNLSGCKIEDHMPEAPPEAHTAAKRVASEIEAANEGYSLEDLFVTAMVADTGNPEWGEGSVNEWSHSDEWTNDAERFGNCLAFMAQGAGVSWFDDHEKFNLTVPYTDAHNDLEYIALTTCDECRALQVDLTDYGVDHAQYFQGHGVYLTEYEHAALGVGDTFAEALEDAITQACESEDGPDYDVLVRAIKSYFPDAWDTGTEGWRAEVSAHDECKPECKRCGCTLDPAPDDVDGEWVDQDGEPMCTEGWRAEVSADPLDDNNEHCHVASEGWHDCELYYHVGLRW